MNAQRNSLWRVKKVYLRSLWGLRNPDLVIVGDTSGNSSCHAELNTVIFVNFITYEWVLEYIIYKIGFQIKVRLVPCQVEAST
ncbi:hypothetical protein D3C73_694490 [compost metagenome]